MANNQISIRKADGSEEVFDSKKLRKSLKRAGAKTKIIDEITNHIEKEIVPGMATEDIYRHAFSLLAMKERPLAARYSLKRAIAALGPSGYPFEKFLAEIFRKNGYYDTKSGVIVQGNCIRHEVDLVAWNGQKLVMGEAKFHHEHSYKTDVKVALYVKARFDDLAETSCSYKEGKRKLDERWLVTNTKFTKEAIKYGNCVGLHLVSWSYPSKGNLQDLVESAGLHPITAMTLLEQHEKDALLKMGIVLCNSLDKQKNILLNLGIKIERLEEILREASELSI